MVVVYENSQNLKESYTEPEPIKNITTSNISDSPFSPFMEIFLQDLEMSTKKNKEAFQSKIKVSEVLGGIARLYERIRTTVEYKGEPVIRRNAIERILKRLSWEKESIRSGIDSKKISQSLIRELIWARYIENDTISENKENELEKVIEKYFYLIKNLDNINQPSNISVVRNWIWGIASSEIEDLLDPSRRELYVRLMRDWFINNFEWNNHMISDNEKLIQIYLAIHRAFTKSDDAILRYHLLLKEFPGWQEASKYDQERLIKIFPNTYEKIEKHLNFSEKFALFRIIQRHSASFEIFRSVSQSNPLNLRKILENEKKIESQIKIVCEEKYKDIKKRVNTGIVRSIIYIFITKVIFAFILEIPFEVLRYGDVRYLPLTINIIFPPFMMLLVGLSIKIPGEKNTLAIISSLKTVIYKTESNSPHIFTTSQIGKSKLLQIFTLVYAILIIAVFTGITFILINLNFTFFAILVFFVFLSLVLLFAYRVAFNSNQLKVESDKEGIFSHLFSYLSLPLLNFGFYLSKGLAKFNFFTVLLDFLIEAPLKKIIQIFEEWSAFIKQKKEEVVEIPE